MSLGRKLFIDWHRKKRVRSDRNAGSDVVDRLKFAKYENFPWLIVFVQPDPDGGPNDLDRVDITDISLRVVINDTADDATPLAEQTSWTKNTSTNTFSGNLNLNTVPLNNFVGSTNKEGLLTIEFQLIDGTGALVKALVELVDVIVGPAQVATSAPDAAKVYASLDEILGICMPRRGKAGDTLTLISPNGVHERILGVRDDATEQDDIL